MDQLTSSMLPAAVGVAFVHTALGPDHYLPFVALAKARGWSLRRTLWITAACGIGHVASSLVLGSLGLAAGVAVGALGTIEGHRGAIAAWILFGVGIAYALWGVRQALRNRPGHSHLLPHAHANPRLVHAHAHPHARGHEDARDGADAHARAAAPYGATTFWALFLVFVLGPCEPLIPLFMVPASEHRWGAAFATGLVFGLVTLATMLAITAMAVRGIALLPLAPLQRWMHTLAGSVIAASAGAVLLLGV